MFGQAPGHGRDLRPQLFEQGFAPRIGIGIELVGPLVQRDQPLADAALRHALRLQDAVDARADLRHLRQPEPVDLVAGHLGGGRRSGRGGIIGLAVRQPPDARVMDRSASQFGDERALPIERGEDPLAHQSRNRLRPFRGRLAAFSLAAISTAGPVASALCRAPPPAA